MDFLNRYISAHRRKLIVAIGILLVGVVATWWTGVDSVQASDRPIVLFQTIPPTPTPKPMTPLPTPTPRPRGGNHSTRPMQPESPSPAASESAPSNVLTGVINATTLNMRQGPGATFPVVGRLSNGTVVTVVARNIDNTWLNVCCLPGSQTKGWVSAQFVTPNYSAAELEALPVGGLIGTVAAVSLNMRAAPFTNAAILGKLSNGASVMLLGRNETSDWWLVCCVPGSAENGWVSAQFITVDADAAVLATLPVTTGDDTPAGAMPTTATPVAASDTLSPTVLVLTAALEPEFPVQGDQLALAFTMTNTGDVAAVNAELSFEVPAGLSFVGASAEDGGEVTAQETDTGATLIVVTWPELAASGATLVKLTLAVDATLADGAVVDGAAAALADNAEATSVSISVGMPPASPPDFR